VSNAPTILTGSTPLFKVNFCIKKHLTVIGSIITIAVSCSKEMNAADEKLRSFLIMEFKTLRKNPYIEEWIDANANYFSPPGALFILEEIDNFIA
jgi:hypothetical protein